jgi:hypothetical protein
MSAVEDTRASEALSVFGVADLDLLLTLSVAAGCREPQAVGSVPLVVSHRP